MAALQACLFMLAYSTRVLAEGPVYELAANIDIDNSVSRSDFNLMFDTDGRYYEWESYDGWFNNPAHPEWGGAGKFCLQLYFAVW